MRIRVLVMCFGISIFQFACSSRPPAPERSQATEAQSPSPESNVKDVTQPSLTPKPAVNPFSAAKDPLAAMGAETDETPGTLEEKDVQCTKASEVRWLQIEPMGDTGCKLWYTKDTGKKAIAWSSGARAHCSKTRTKIVDRLRTEGFSCQEE